MAKFESKYPSLSVSNPDIAKEWHSTKNGDLTLDAVSKGSGKVVWWICGNGHEWTESVYARTKKKNSTCSRCLNPPITETHPDLVKEWNYEKNRTIRPEKITAGSGRKVWWTCKEGHDWEAVVGTRTNLKSGCPDCHKIRFREEKKNYIPLYHKSLAYLNSELSSQWHEEKNDKKPEHFTPGSNKKVWWKCKENENHEWEAAIADRKKSSCPYCAGQKVSREKSFGATHPHLVKEWHSTKNEGLTPYDVMPSTHKKAWFLCSKNPNHEWEAYIFNRSKGKGCPYCSGHKATDETSLLAMYPELCEEWNYVKNEGKRPNDYKPMSNEKVWWKCSKGHEWEMVISSRSSSNQGCPECNKKSKTSFPEQAILFYIKKAFPEAENRKKLPFLDNNSEADIFIGSLNLAIEYDGYYHLNYPERDERKNNLMRENKVQLIRVRQFVGDRKLPVVNGHGSIVIQHDYNHKKGLDKCIKEIFSVIEENYSVAFTDISIDTHRERGEILKQLGENERNLETIFPHLAEEWHPDKNGTLLPSQVSPFAHIDAWWKCKKDERHEWQAKVGNRSNGRKCPYCSNKKINYTNSLATLMPELAKQWHPTKNGKLTPNEVALNYSKNVWWQCDKDERHEWEITPNKRVQSANPTRCPYCSGRKRVGT